MTYFNPKIFCKQNLKERDLNELEFWKSEFDNCVENTLANEQDYDDSTIAKMKNEIIEEFAEALKTNWGYVLQDVVVADIEDYDDDVEEYANPETFFYESEEEDGDN